MQNDKITSDSPEPKHGGSSARVKELWAKVKTNKIAWAIALVVVIALIAGVVFAMGKKPEPKPAESNKPTATKLAPKAVIADGAFMQQYGQNCKERDVKFTSAPMKMDELSYIRPLGAMGDGHVTPTDHVYIGGPDRNVPDNTYAVLMPADGTVTQVSAMPAQYVGDQRGQKLANEDHRIIISHSCRYFSIYIHVHKLSDTLKAAVGKLQPNENKQANVELKAGDIVGYIGGSTFDWTPLDTTKSLTGFITPKLYDGEPWKIHTVSPFDLYEGTLKKDLEDKSLRTVAPIGGKIDYDQPGKLIGTWFKDGSGGYSGMGGNNSGRYWDGHLSIVPDYIHPTSTIVSIGNWNGNAKQLVVSGTVNPAKITKDSGLVKYELKRLNYLSKDGAEVQGDRFTKDMQPSQNERVEGVILLQVLPDEKLKVEKFPGRTSTQVNAFTNAAQTYGR